jgi:hypothetical protein
MEMQQMKVRKEELMALSVRGRVVFAARCARRAQQAFCEWNKDCGNAQYAASVEEAIKLAEDFVGGRRPVHEISAGFSDVERAAILAAEAANLN